MEKDPEEKKAIPTLWIHEKETFPYPRPKCPQCDRFMRWFWIESMPMKGWFCNCPNLEPLKPIGRPDGD